MRLKTKLSEASERALRHLGKEEIEMMILRGRSPVDAEAHQRMRVKEECAVTTVCESFSNATSKMKTLERRAVAYILGKTFQTISEIDEED